MARTTVVELIDILKNYPAMEAVHIWTSQEEMSEIDVYEDRAESSSGFGDLVVKIRGH